MSGADLLPAAPPSAVAAAAAAKVEPSADQAAAAPPSEQPPLEQGRQDEAMSVTTVPDEAVKQEAAEPAGRRVALELRGRGPFALPRLVNPQDLFRLDLPPCPLRDGATLDLAPEIEAWLLQRCQ